MYGHLNIKCSLLLVATANATLVYVTADNNIYRDDSLRIHSVS